jgi:hypothetical protein
MPEKRSWYENLARENGYEAVDSVTVDLNVLVATDPEGNSSKITKAKKHGTQIFSLEEWLEMMEKKKSGNNSSSNTPPPQKEQTSRNPEGSFDDLPLFEPSNTEEKRESPSNTDEDDLFSYSTNT